MRKGLPACCLARAKGGLAPPLFLSVTTRPLSFSLHLSSFLSLLLTRSLSSLSTSRHLSSFLGLSAFTFCSPRHPGLVTTFPPTEPPTPRLRDDVNSHAHVFKLPHHVRVIWSGSCTRFLTSKANASCSSGEPKTFRTLLFIFYFLSAGYFQDIMQCII